MTRRRPWLLVPLLGCHALLVLLTRPAVQPAPPPAVGALQVAQVPAPRPVPVRFELPEVVIPANASAPDIEVAAEAPGTGCALSDEIQLALRDSAAVRTSLARVPPSARSVAAAVMVWDGAWADAGRLGGEAALGPLREAVRARVGAASAPCRAARLAGPRLIYVEVAGATMILAFGSGEWSWDELLIQ